MARHLFLFLFFSVILFSCSSSDDDITDDSNDEETTEGTTINPPSWIQGTWILKNSSLYSGFKFTTDDLCIISSAYYQCCNKETIELYKNTEIYTNVCEEITNNYYSVEITISSSVAIYQFEKVSDTEIKWLGTSSDVTYVKQ
jgi:hypothetical protein